MGDTPGHGRCTVEMTPDYSRRPIVDKVKDEYGVRTRMRYKMEDLVL